MISFPNIRMNPLFLGFWYNVLVSTTYVCNDCGFVCNTMELTLPLYTCVTTDLPYIMINKIAFHFLPSV